MDAKLKEDWVKALRSGAYRQGLGSLNQGSSYCCLGVLVVVAGLDMEEAKMSYATIPLQDGAINKLQSMNDIDGRTFPEIADYIEANIPTDPVQP